MFDERTLAGLAVCGIFVFFLIMIRVNKRKHMANIVMSANQSYVANTFDISSALHLASEEGHYDQFLRELNEVRRVTGDDVRLGHLTWIDRKLNGRGGAKDMPNFKLGETTSTFQFAPTSETPEMAKVYNFSRPDENHLINERARNDVIAPSRSDNPGVALIQTVCLQRHSENASLQSDSTCSASDSTNSTTPSE